MEWSTREKLDKDDNVLFFSAATTATVVGDYDNDNDDEDDNDGKNSYYAKCHFYK